MLGMFYNNYLGCINSKKMLLLRTIHKKFKNASIGDFVINRVTTKKNQYCWKFIKLADLPNGWAISKVEI